MNLVERAKNFAIQKHADQKYGEYAYSYHLNYVTNILIEFGYETDESVMATSWLHDVLEDTEATYEMLLAEFGLDVADIVRAITTEPGKNREERFQNTVPKIQANSKAIVVKLADRIANTECSQRNNTRLYKMYVKEFPLFKTHLYNPQDVTLRPMWERLSQLSSHSLTN